MHKPLSKDAVRVFQRRSLVVGVLSSALLSIVLVGGLFLSPRWLAHASAAPAVLLLHGFSGSCGSSMGDAATYLKGNGLGVVNLGYYSSDSGCDASLLASYGPTNYTGVANCSALDTSAAQTADKQKTISTSYAIEKLGYHLAWYIYQNYSLNGQYVDLLAHSMGGLIIRSAIAQTSAQASSGCSAAIATSAGLGPLPPTLLISRVATLSTPHDGTDIAYLDPFASEAVEMEPGSSFLKTLATTDITGDAQWLTIGEKCVALLNSDGVVSAKSASWPDGVGEIQRVTYDSCKYVHTNIEDDESTTMDQTATIAPEGSAASSGTVHTGCYRPLAMSNDWFENLSSPACSN